MQLPSRKVFLSRTALIAWAILCLAAYAAYPGRISHINQFIFKGWGSALASFPGQLFSPLGFLWGLFSSFAGVVIFSLACISLGIFLLRLFGDLRNTGAQSLLGLLAYLATAFLLGQIIISSIFLILGAAFELTKGMVILSLVVMLLLGGYSFWKTILDARKKLISSPDTEQITPVDRVIFWLCLAVLVLSLLASSARLSYDAMALYFSQAKATAMANSVQFFANDSFIVSSFHIGIQYAALIQVFGDQAARMYSWVGGLFFLIYSLALAENLGLTRRAILILAALILTSTAYLDLMGDGKIDLAVAAPALASVYWLVVDRGSPGKSAAPLLAGLLAGYAVISRPFNGFLVPVLILSWSIVDAFAMRKSQPLDLRLLLRRLLWVAAGGLVMLGFHLYANWMILGDPLAFLSNAAKIDSSAWQWSFNAENLWAYRALYPFVVTFINSPQSLGNISPLFLSLMPVFLVRDLRRSINLSKELVSLLTAATITLAAWLLLLFTIQEIRYVLFLWAILLMPAALLMDSLMQSNERALRALAIFATIGLLIFIGLRTMLISFATYSPVDQAGAAHCSNSPFCDLLEPVNREAAKGARVLTMNAYRYYLRPDLFICSTRAEEYALLQQSWMRGADAFWAEVHRQGYQYITYEKNFTFRHLYMQLIPDAAQTPSWMQLQPIYSSPDKNQRSYRIVVAENAPIRAEKTCKQGRGGVWEIRSAAD